MPFRSKESAMFGKVHNCSVNKSVYYIYLFEFINKMNEFISPHQNININISYNLGQQQKMPKVVFGKKIAKIVKSTMKDQPKSFFKTFKKNEQHIIPSEQVKKGKSAKNNKAKKKSQNLLTLPDQDQIMPRRLKTEGNARNQIMNSLAKKQPKNNLKSFSKSLAQHSKSVNNPPACLNIKQKSLTNKKSVEQCKLKKQERRQSNKSCILYQPKKNMVLSDIEHIISTSVNAPTPSNLMSNLHGNSGQTSKAVTKKRANSANVIRSDKFINKLLDMSVLTSELGGSITMVGNSNNEEQSKNRVGQNTNNRIKNALQGFMNSIDLRIIKKMEQDNHSKNKIFVDSEFGSGMQLIQFLTKVRRIPIEKLHEKAEKIQKFWRNKTGESIVPYYSKIFFRNPVINSKAAIQQKLNDISEIDIKNLQSEVDADQKQICEEDQSVKRNTQKKGLKSQIYELISFGKMISPDKQKSEFEQQSISAAKVQKMLEEKSSNSQDSRLEHVEQYQCGEDDSQQVIQQPQTKNKYFKQFKEQLQQEAKQKPSLNIERYKQLVKQSIQQNKQNSDKFPKLSAISQKIHESRQQKVLQHAHKKTTNQHSLDNRNDLQGTKEAKNGKNQPETAQSAHWNHVHNILSSNMNKKVPIMSKAVLEQLMKQSAYNKQWVEGQFQRSYNSHSNGQSKRLSGSSRERITPNYSIEQKQSEQQQSLPRHPRLNAKLEGKQLQKYKQKQQKQLQQIQIQQIQFLDVELVGNQNKRQQKQGEKSFDQFQQNSFDENNDLCSEGIEQEDTEKQQYNWNKYSDISKLKKAQEITTKNKHKDILKDQKLGGISENNLDTIQKQKQKQKQEENIKQLNNEIPGLLPSGLTNNAFTVAGKNRQRQKQQIGDKKQCNTLDLDFDEEFDEPPASQQEIQPGQAHKDEKWIRQQMIMEDGIVQKYLDCGLDYFGISMPTNINASEANGKYKNMALEQVQQQEVEEKQQHRATLKKQHNHGQDGKIKNKKNQLHPHSKDHKEDDIFSNDAEHKNYHDDHMDDDMELVYVFNNSANHWNKQVDLEHAVKNSKRKDNVAHLGNREDQSQLNFKAKQISANGAKKADSTQISEIEVSVKKVQIKLFQPSFKTPNDGLIDIQQKATKQQEETQSQQLLQQQKIQEQLDIKRKQKATQYIITKLIQQFAQDVSIILRRSHNIGGNEQPQLANSQGKNMQNRLVRTQATAANNSNNNSQNQSLSTSTNNKGINTSFQSVRDFITKIKSYILAEESYCRKMIQNLKNNIGPTSMEILSYLRIEQSAEFPTEESANFDNQVQEEDNEQFLFVIPNNLFQLFNQQLLAQEQEARSNKLTNRYKLYTQFWHRSIFQCYNQCLDFQRPYGVTGAPYAWITEPKLPRPIQYSKEKVSQLLQNAQGRLLEMACSSAGIIFDKFESPYRQFNITEEQKIQMNQQKISRMLANEIIDDEYNWITYNDEITELQVDISRKIYSDLRKIMRKRKVMAQVAIASMTTKMNRPIGENGSSSEEEQHAVFMMEDLV